MRASGRLMIRTKLIRRKPLKHDKERPRRRERRQATGAHSLTICIAALADSGNAVVCVADKMLSFGDYSQWESDVTKIVRIPKTAEMDTYALMAGGLGECEAVLNEIYGIGNLDDS